MAAGIMVNPYIALRQPGELAEGAVRGLFETEGWQVDRVTRPDRGLEFALSDNRGKFYHAVLKTSTEGRSDRMTPLFAQALLEARAHARSSDYSPAVIFWVTNATQSLAKRLKKFHLEYGNREPFALLSPHGPLYADFPGLPEVVIDEDTPFINSMKIHTHLASPPLVFSDNAQWMLKLLLAAEMKRDGLLTAPPKRYRTATELAHKAAVSVMTATRLINALKAEGFIETDHTLRLVQRRRLAQLWKAVYHKTVTAVPMKFMTLAAPEAQLDKLLRREPAILGMFAAAHALGVGHVHGTVPAVWVPELAAAQEWRGVRRALEGERPDLIFHQHAFPRSMTQGAVQIGDKGDKRATDIIQTWLDVSAHPTRGAEQAGELEEGILAGVIGEYT